MTRPGAIVTGASRGLGRAIAARCLADGWQVLICARDEGELEAARRGLADAAPDRHRLLAHVADVADAAQVEDLVTRGVADLDDLAALVNNAGGYGPIGPLETTDPARWSAAIATNLLGTVAACRAVIPVLRARGGGRIVNLSGGGATAPLPRFSAYASSKAAVVRFTETIAHELAESGIIVNAVAPGSLDTAMLDQMIAAGPDLVGEVRHAQARSLKASGGDSIERAAALVAHLLSSRSGDVTGRLISAVWDDWESLAADAERLEGSDVYTLRRISPGDRGWTAE